MKYEYQILKTDEPTASQEQLDSYGKDGWQLITILRWEDHWFYYFMRIRADANN